MSTTQEQIEGVRELCRLLEQRPEVKSATVDDWGRFGNFTVFVTPENPDRYTTARLQGWLRQAVAQAKCSAHVREIFSPDPVVRRNAYGKPKVVGYRVNYWTVDIDYQQYHAPSNTFS